MKTYSRVNGALLPSPRPPHVVFIVEPRRIARGYTDSVRAQHRNGTLIAVLFRAADGIVTLVTGARAVIFDHVVNKVQTAIVYTPPVAYDSSVSTGGVFRQILLDNLPSRDFATELRWT